MSDILTEEVFQQCRTHFMAVDADRTLAAVGNMVCGSHQALRAELEALKTELADERGDYAKLYSLAYAVVRAWRVWAIDADLGEEARNLCHYVEQPKEVRDLMPHPPKRLTFEEWRQEFERFCASQSSLPESAG